MLKYAAAALCVAAGVAAGCGGSDKEEPEGPQKLGPQALVKQNGPSTVKLYGRWGEGTTAGTGVVIDAKHGYVLTNAHVLEGATGMKAQINDQPEEYTARIRATAPCEDLAVVELISPPANLKAMKLGNSGKLKAGQHVTTLGYPGTLEKDPTAATSSKLVFADGRISTPETASDLDGFGDYSSLVQHTATVNHGNSGGPLVDDYGRLIGINSLTNSPEAEDQFYSITIDHAKPVIEKLTKGISMSDVGWVLAPFNLDTAGPILKNAGFNKKGIEATIGYMASEEDYEGVYVRDTRAGTPSERADITRGDFVSRIDDNKVSSPSEVCDAFESATPGSIVRVHGRYLDSAFNVDDPDILPGDAWTVNVRVPEEEVK